MTFEDFIYKRNYARFIEDKRRREKWDESVSRYRDFFKETQPLTPDLEKAVEAFRQKQVVGSMRCLWTAGPALKKENACGYNCWFLNIESVQSFADYMYLLMCGGGVGYSVEDYVVQLLPTVPAHLTESPCINIIYDDSREGWRYGFEVFLHSLYSGYIPAYDLSKLRPKGARLKTFGGYASGPEPLQKLMDWTIELFKKARGRKLTTIECYDLCCHIASVIIAGGTRRSASIALFSHDDRQMFFAKAQEFYNQNPQRCYANNSMVFSYKPPKPYFDQYWADCIANGTGEPGIFNNTAVFRIIKQSDRDTETAHGCNPCGEIVLRPNQACNLSEVIIRPHDTDDELEEKVIHAVTLGVYQSLLTNFNQQLSPEFRENCQDERLLGVSLTGLRDHYKLKSVSQNARHLLMKLRVIAWSQAMELCDELNINRPKAITCVKPSGTVSKLMNTSSGMHPRYAPFYIQRIRSAMTDPLTLYMMNNDMPWHPENGEDHSNCNTVVFSFPIKSPKGARCIKDVTAIDQLEYYKMLQQYWCDHNASCTIYVREDEWDQARDWVYKNWKWVSGITFYPVDTTPYPQAPYEEITEDQYYDMIHKMPEIDLSKLVEYYDCTKGAQTFACAGGACEI